VYDGTQEWSSHYKVSVGKGNNSVMVRSLFKTRFWWLLHDKEELDKVNLIWTQNRKQTVMAQLRCKLTDSKQHSKPKKRSDSSAKPEEPAKKPNGG
jgi:tubulin polyglutamylase TTLL1/tubulin monoglycylase TTLL3/8